MRGFSPLLPGVTHAPFPYCYRCPFGKTYPSCDFYCIDYFNEELFAKYVPSDEVAALVFEPIQGEGGYIVPPPAYFQTLKKRVADPHGILLVADEVQTGIGRTGRWFASENFGLIPDMVCAAKALSSGLPIGALIARKDLMTWEVGAHGSTFGGNPVAAAAALATLDIIKRERLLANAARQGAYIQQRFREMQSQLPFIGDVRGKGLMIGVELVKDGKTKEPATEEAKEVISQSWKSGVLLITAGKSTLRLAPPLTITRELVDEALDVLERVLRRVARGMRRSGADATPGARVAG